jgi:hypothetical protein
MDVLSCSYDLRLALTYPSPVEILPPGHFHNVFLDYWISVRGNLRLFYFILCFWLRLCYLSPSLPFVCPACCCRFDPGAKEAFGILQLSLKRGSLIWRFNLFYYLI